MNHSMLVIIPFLLTFLLSLLLTPITIYFFRYWGFLVDAKKQIHPAHVHKGAVPKGGGIPIVLSITIVGLLFLKLNPHLIAILLGLWIALLVGVVDDIRPLSPYWRLGFNFLVAAIVVGAGIGIAYITNPLGGVIDLSYPRLKFDFLGETHQIWLLADIFALIWIPFLMNAVNFSSGLDGQVSGVVAIAAGVIGLLSLRYVADINQWPVTMLAFSLAGAFTAFSIFHFYPQKIMPGYSGTSTAGFLLAVLAILSTAKVGTALVVLGIPFIDAIYSIIRRVAAGKSPFHGDRGHLHHRLMDVGWGKRRIALFYWFITLFLGIIALKTNAEMKLFAILAVSILMAGFFLWIYFGPWLKPLGRDNG